MSIIGQLISEIYDYYINQFYIGALTYGEAAKACCVEIDEVIRKWG